MLVLLNHAATQLATWRSRSQEPHASSRPRLVYSTVLLWGPRGLLTEIFPAQFAQISGHPGRLRMRVLRRSSWALLLALVPLASAQTPAATPTPITCDVAIIGGGAAGASTAVFLKDKGYKVRRPWGSCCREPGPPLMHTNIQIWAVWVDRSASWRRRLPWAATASRSRCLARRPTARTGWSWARTCSATPPTSTR